MILVLGTLFTGLLGLAFGSFLNVCLSRWPHGESVIKPPSHCRACNHTLTWWENIPLLSWIGLRGRCRRCGTRISLQYPLVEAAVGMLWGWCFWAYLRVPLESGAGNPEIAAEALKMAGMMAFYWLSVALAVLDWQHFWLPNMLTYPGILIGLGYSIANTYLNDKAAPENAFWQEAGLLLAGTVIAAGIILLIRWVYWLIRRQEGLGLGDAKLMAMLAAWLGLPGALLSFGIGVVLGAIFAVFLSLPTNRREQEHWRTSKLPLGTFLCIGGVVSGLWGSQLIAMYRRLAGF